MRKLREKQRASKASLVALLREKEAALGEAVKAYNEALTLANEQLCHALDAYNEAVKEANQFCDEVIAEIEECVAERSEGWWQTRAGMATTEWLNEWREELDGADLPEEPKVLEAPYVDAADRLDDLDAEPDH